MGVLTGLLVACAGSPPPSVSAEERLQPCPSAPRCVSSRAEDPERRVAPIGYAIERERVREILIDVIRSWPRTEIVEVDADYVHATQRSRWFGFVDDLECHLPAEEGLVHLRSAARVGYYDFGVNRERVERLRRAVNERLAAGQAGDSQP